MHPATDVLELPRAWRWETAVPKRDEPAEASTGWHLRLKARLAEKGMSVDALARATGAKKSTVHSLAQGRVANPRPELLAAVARELGVTQAWLLYGVAGEPKAAESGREIPVFSMDDAWMSPGERAVAGYVSFSTDGLSPRAFAMRVSNDTGHPAAPAGSIIIVDPDGELRAGTLVLALVEDRPVIGYTQRGKFRPVFEARYGEMSFAPGTQDGVIGSIVWVRHAT